MAAVAIFSCRPNSHPFQERQVALLEPVKIGRSVARARPAPNNAIFDCKVLSRNHALLWYDKGKFFLQDTKSSNGTFVNNQRLSKGSEESLPREIYSGDMVQFGVDVMENSRRVTHGCIISSVQLYHPDGTECKASPSNAFPNFNAMGASMQAQEIYQLAQYLQEALHREQMLESKLATLQGLLRTTQAASETGWQAMIDEDRLLSRIEVLENQLLAYSKNQTEESLQQEIVALQEDKYKYEKTSKESLRKVLQEKLDAVRKLTELENSLGNTEEECKHLKETCEASQLELEALAKKHEEQLNEVELLETKLQEAERQHAEEIDVVSREKDELQNRLEDILEQESALTAKVESLQADNDFTKEQLTNMKARMETIKEKGSHDDENENISIPGIDSQGIQVDMMDLLEIQLLQSLEEEDFPSDDEEKQQTLKEKLRATQELIGRYKTKINESESRLQESQVKIEKLQDQLEQAQLEIVEHVAKISSIEVQLNESKKQCDNSSQYSRQLKETIADLEFELKQYKQEDEKRNRSLPSILPEKVIDLANSNSLPNHTSDVESRTLRASSSSPVSNINQETSTNSPTLSNGVSNGTPSNELQEEVDKLKRLLEEAKGSHKNAELQVHKFRNELESAELQAKESKEEADALKTQLNSAKHEVKQQSDHVTSLQEQLNKAETTTKEVKQQILELRDRLIEEQEQARSRGEEMDKLRQQLQDAQLLSKQSKNETEQLRSKVKNLQVELEYQTQSGAPPSEDSTKEEMKRQAARNKVEFASLKEECANLKYRIQDIEKDMKFTRTENKRLEGDYHRLQESYHELEEMKNKLEDNESDWKNNLTDAQKSSDLARLDEAHAEICKLRDKCNEYQEEISRLKDEMSNMNVEFEELSYRSWTLSQCSMIPLIMLLFAFLLAFYPLLANVTATTSPT